MTTLGPEGGFGLDRVQYKLALLSYHDMCLLWATASPPAHFKYGKSEPHGKSAVKHINQICHTTTSNFNSLSKRIRIKPGWCLNSPGRNRTSDPVMPIDQLQSNALPSELLEGMVPNHVFGLGMTCLLCPVLPRSSPSASTARHWRTYSCQPPHSWDLHCCVSSACPGTCKAFLLRNRGLVSDMSAIPKSLDDCMRNAYVPAIPHVGGSCWEHMAPYGSSPLP